jgi:hypothetical protein
VTCTNPLLDATLGFCAPPRAYVSNRKSLAIQGNPVNQSSMADSYHQVGTGQLGLIAEKRDNSAKAPQRVIQREDTPGTDRLGRVATSEAPRIVGSARFWTIYV